MFPSQFEYHRAASVKDALDLLKQFGDDAKLLSGGHSLIPMMKLRLAQPAHLIDVTKIAELRAIAESNGKIVIGATATHDTVANSDLVRAKLGLLAEAAAAIGDVQVRNRGTIGGSLTHADPAADYPAAALALEAEIKLDRDGGSRTVKAADFFLDLMTTAIQPGELLTQVAFAPIPSGTGYAYLKYPHPASGFAIVGVAAIAALDRSGKFANLRVGVTGLGPKAFRATAVEAALAGKAADAATIAAAASKTDDGVDALGDIHASSEYRSELARVYARRAIQAAVARAKA